MGSAKVRRTRRARHPEFAVLAVVCLIVAAVAASSASAKPGGAGASIKVGLITKDVTNPFFVKMKAGATAQAKKLGATLVYAAGKNSSDNASQITAIENMVTSGVKGILITVADAKAENAAIAKARKAGVLVIALDSPTTPTTAVDALFATNNLNAGILIGKYARAATKGKTVTIAMLDEHAGSSVGALRHNGFTKGFGIKNSDKQIVCVANGGGDTPDSQTAMENCLQKNPNIDVVYTINEPSAAGAWTALKNAGKSQSDVTIVSVDGGCAGVRNVKAGIIDATSQQYPLLMASRGVGAVVSYAKGGKKASGYTDTGVNLIAKTAVAGVTSKSVSYGLSHCWG
ncbi:MAG: substrate-binding domain-containing protein, partial [Actinomycetota bacterium]|nr:substrate-binding domain-containing protein [Actinomycetota bacterium]